MAGKAGLARLNAAAPKMVSSARCGSDATVPAAIPSSDNSAWWASIG